jgi:hypothetical protein
MLHYWEYFATKFENPRKAVKKIKKAKNFKAYDLAVKSIFESEFELIN